MWVKKIDENFDVTMGAYDGAEICEKDIGLYRDDGLAVFSNVSVLQSRCNIEPQRRNVSTVPQTKRPNYVHPQ